MDYSPTRVAILATSEKTQQQLSSLLEEAGLTVVADDLPSDGFLKQLETAAADVLLVDLSEENGSEIAIIDTLLDYDALPIFFNDSSPAGGGANAVWAKKLARKLATVAVNHLASTTPESTPSTIEPIATSPTSSLEEVNPLEIDELALEATLPAGLQLDEATPEELRQEQIHDTHNLNTALATEELSELSLLEDTSLNKPKPQLDNKLADEVSSPPSISSVEKPEGAAINTWVLGASLGGPQAVRQFLAAIEEDLPVAFILAQHIGANHISLLAEQLNRVTPFKVVPGRAGQLIQHHEVILTPADMDIKITNDGYLSLIPADQNAIYSPSIDNVIDAVATHYGNMAGTIVFSGMGDDGARGCEAMAKHGGIVWAQDVDSCVISSMPDQARKTNTVTFSANPQALAKRLYEYYHE